MSALTLRGRRVLVTGASGALGGATVAALRARGAAVAGIDVAGGDSVIACDVRDNDSVRAAVAQARIELGGLDAVVHFAGIGVPPARRGTWRQRPAHARRQPAGPVACYRGVHR